MPPPPSDTQNQQAVQQLLQGMNTMQMRSGLMPGGVGQLPPMITPLPAQARTSDIPKQLHVQFAQLQQSAQPLAAVYGGAPAMQRPLVYGPDLPSMSFGTGRSAARSTTTATFDRAYGAASSTTGLAARAIGDTAAFALGGPIGLAAFELLGGGQMAQDMGSAMMTPLVRQREMALQLRNQSMSSYRGGSAMDAGGRGMSLSASSQLASQLTSLQGSSGFKHATGGMFNQQDMQKISSLAGQMGMLEQSGSVDEIARDIGKISRGLSNFMKIAQQPDVVEAMRSLGQMRALGMTVDQSGVATQNARQFSRMAGVSVGEMLQTGMQSAGVFQRRGLSGASGMEAGMAATGMASALASQLGERQLAMAGGADGIARTLAQGAAQTATIDAMLPAMLTHRDGKLAVDREQLMRLARGELNVQQAMQDGVSRLQGTQSLMELATRRRELQDEVQQMAGGSLSVLMPLIQARSTAQSVPGMTMGAALRTQMGEEQARTYEQMLEAPGFWDTLRDQDAVTRRERGYGRARGRSSRDAAHSYYFGEPLRAVNQAYDAVSSRGGTAVERIGGLISHLSDVSEERGVAGGGFGIDWRNTSRWGSDEQRLAGRARLAQVLSTPGGASAEYSGMLRSMDGAAGVVSSARDEDNVLNRGRQMGVLGSMAATINESALSVTRGRSSLTEVVRANLPYWERQRIDWSPGGVNSRQQIEALAQDQLEVGSVFAQSPSTPTALRTRQREAVKALSDTAGLSTVERQRMVGIAAASVNGYLSNTTALFSTEQVSMSSIRQNVRSEMISAGLEPAKADAFVNSQDFMAHAITVGSEGRSESAQIGVDRLVAAGGAVNAVITAETRGALLDSAESRRRSSLHQLGVSTGMFSSTSGAQQRAVLNALVGDGEGGADAQARRRMMAVMALEERGKDTGRGVVEAGQSLERFLDDFGEEAATKARASLSGVGKETLRTMGDRLSGMNSVMQDSTMASAYAGAQGATRDDNTRMLIDELGEGGARALLSDTGGVSALKAYLETNPEGIAREKRERLLRGITSGSVTRETLVTAASRRVSGTSVATFMDSVDQVVEDNPMEEIYDGLENSVNQGRRGPTAAEVANTQAFGSAVGTLNIASRRLQRAATAMESRGEHDNINQVVQRVEEG